MKKMTVLSLALLSMASSAHSYELISKIEKYIDNSTNKVIELSANDINKSTQKATYFDYALGKKVTVDTSLISKATKERINGVRAGDNVAMVTKTSTGKEIVKRACVVFHVFENEKGYVGCRSSQRDEIPGYITPDRFDFIVSDLSTIDQEVESLDGFKKGQRATLDINTDRIEAGKKVRILSVLKSGDAIIQRAGLSILDTSSIIHKSNIEIISLKYLTK